jgi:dTDP-4-amino-4,6-dideoxygalactose transaminase
VRAAVGLVQLGRLEAANAARAKIAYRYQELLDGVEGLVVPFADQHNSSAHHLAVVVLPQGVSRERIREAMRKHGVQTSVHYPPIHHFSLYADADSRRELPMTDDVADRVLTLPLYPHLEQAQVEAVGGALLDALGCEVAPRPG